MMKFNNETVRRRDRLMTEERALELLRTAEYGVLNMIDADGLPYGIPVNHVWDGDSSIYIHCAPEVRSFGQASTSEFLHCRRCALVARKVYHRI